jgi:hypothetical protein
LLPDYIAQYETELEVAKKECNIHGIVEKNLTSLPGITEQYYSSLQEIEGVLNYLNIQLDVIQQKHYKKYLEHYARALTSRDAERYASNEPDVVDMKLLIGEVALLRNQYLAIMKGLEAKNFMLGHIVKLRSVGLENITI